MVDCTIVHMSHICPVCGQDALDESISQSTTFLTEGGVSGGGANSDTLTPDQIDNLSERKLRKAQVQVDTA